MRSNKNDRKGLKPIPVYDIERHYYLHELRQVRARYRVGRDSYQRKLTKELQKELCNTRSRHYG